MSNEYEFGKFFTKDGYELIVNYLSSLKNYLNQSGISPTQSNTVINGIFEFIFEFAEDFRNEKISFSKTLKLIDDIGSPSEIVQSFDFQREIEEKTLTCPHCSFKNQFESHYCEYCGKFIKGNVQDKLLKKEEEDLDYHKIKENKLDLNQEFIDHPYAGSFVICSVLFSLILDIYITSTYMNTQYSLIAVFMIGLPVSFFITLFPAILLSIFTGFILDFLYRDKKSIKFRYDKIIMHFEENMAGGFLLIIFGITVFSFFFTVSSESFIFPFVLFIWFIILILSLIFVLYHDRTSQRPYNLNLTQLTHLKYVLEKDNKKSLLLFNKRLAIPIMLTSIMTTILNYDYVSKTVTSYSLPSNLLVLFIGYIFSYLIISNGYKLIELNSWKSINKIAVERNLY